MPMAATAGAGAALVLVLHDDMGKRCRSAVTRQHGTRLRLRASKPSCSCCSCAGPRCDTFPCTSSGEGGAVENCVNVDAQPPCCDLTSASAVCPVNPVFCGLPDCRYHCQEAIDTLALLPPRQYETGWVLAQCGRAYLEMTQFKKVQCVCVCGDLSYRVPPSIAEQ